MRWQGAGSYQCGRRSTAWRCKLRTISGSFTHVLNLSAYRRGSRIMHHGQLLRRGPRIDSAAPAVVTDPVALDCLAH